MIKNIKTLLMITLCLFSFNAFALDLETAKNKGFVGEANSGYLVALKENKEVTVLVKNINAKRKEAYIKRANKLNVPLEVFELRMADKLEEKAKNGHYIEIKNEKWIRVRKTER